jgi:hypothetical protein
MQSVPPIRTAADARIRGGWQVRLWRRGRGGVGCRTRALPSLSAGQPHTDEEAEKTQPGKAHKESEHEWWAGSRNTAGRPLAQST